MCELPEMQNYSVTKNRKLLSIFFIIIISLFSVQTFGSFDEIANGLELAKCSYCQKNVKIFPLYCLYILEVVS
jgi:hypothetical protein